MGLVELRLLVDSSKVEQSNTNLFIVFRLRLNLKGQSKCARELLPGDENHAVRGMDFSPRVLIFSSSRLV